MVPPSSSCESPFPTKLAIKQCDQNDNWDRYTEQVQKNRAHWSASLGASSLQYDDLVPLPAADGRGHARAKCADQESDENPDRYMGPGLSRRVGGLTRLRH